MLRKEKSSLEILIEMSRVGVKLEVRKSLSMNVTCEQNCRVKDRVREQGQEKEEIKESLVEGGARAVLLSTECKPGRKKKNQNSK